MGFLDPLFAKSIFLFLGIIGAYFTGVPLTWLSGEIVFALGSIFILSRDWNIFIAKDNENKSVNLFTRTSKSYLFYCFWLVISICVGIGANITGMVGDKRLSTSPIKKLIDVVWTFALPMSTFQYQIVNRYIPKRMLPTLTIGITAPLVLGASKSAGLTALFWASQRYINKESPFFAFKIKKLKIKIVPTIITILIIFMIILLLQRITASNIFMLINVLSTRLSRELDIYIFLKQISLEQGSEAFNRSGGWIGNLLGNLSGYTENIGSLLKSYATNRPANATGANPRIMGIMLSSMRNSEISFIILSITVAIGELSIMSKARKKFIDAINYNNMFATFGFIAVSNLVYKAHADLGSLKYSIITMAIGLLITRIRLKGYE